MKDLLDICYDNIIIPANKNAVMITDKKHFNKRLKELDKLEDSYIKEFLLSEVKFVGAFYNEYLIPNWDKKRKTVFLGKWSEYPEEELYIRFAPKYPNYIVIARQHSSVFDNWFYFYDNNHFDKGLLFPYLLYLLQVLNEVVVVYQLMMLP